MIGHVRLGLPAKPENVAVVRQALAGVAEALAVEPALAADMKIAVTEACANAVVHAYEDGEGSLEVSMAVEGTRLTVGVRDRGTGFKPLPTRGEGPSFGYGLALIATLADAFAIQGGSAGMEVLMTFELDEPGESLARPPVPQPEEEAAPPPAGVVAMRLSAGPLVAPVLCRVISLLAARADFSLDRLSDAQLVSDILATHVASHAVDGHVALVVDQDEKGLDLRVGPLVPGGADRLVEATALPGVGRLLEQLSAAVAVEPLDGDGAAELLRVGLAQAG